MRSRFKDRLWPLVEYSTSSKRQCGRVNGTEALQITLTDFEISEDLDIMPEAIGRPEEGAVGKYAHVLEHTMRGMRTLVNAACLS